MGKKENEILVGTDDAKFTILVSGSRSSGVTALAGALEKRMKPEQAEDARWAVYDLSGLGNVRLRGYPGNPTVVRLHGEGLMLVGREEDIAALADTIVHLILEAEVDEEQERLKSEVERLRQELEQAYNAVVDAAGYFVEEQDSDSGSTDAHGAYQDLKDSIEDRKKASEAFLQVVSGRQAVDNINKRRSDHVKV